MKKFKKIIENKSTLDNIFYACLVFLPLVQFAIFYIGVNARSIMFVFQKYDGNNYVANGFANFATAFSNFSNFPVWKDSLVNSLIIYAVGIIISTPLGILFSAYIYKKRAGSQFFRIMLFLPTIFPPAVMTLMYSGVTDSVIPTIVRMIDPNSQFVGILAEKNYVFDGLLFYSIWMGFGTNVLMYVSTMTAIPESVVEASELDGCNAIKEFFYITLPYIWPTFTTFMVVGISGIFTNQFNIYTFFGVEGQEKGVVTIGYLLFRDTERATPYDYPILATYGVMFTIIAAPLTFLLKHVMNKFGYSAE